MLLRSVAIPAVVIDLKISTVIFLSVFVTKNLVIINNLVSQNSPWNLVNIIQYYEVFSNVFFTKIPYQVPYLLFTKLLTSSQSADVWCIVVFPFLSTLKPGKIVSVLFQKHHSDLTPVKHIVFEVIWVGLSISIQSRKSWLRNKSIRKPTWYLISMILSNTYKLKEFN